MSAPLTIRAAPADAELAGLGEPGSGPVVALGDAPGSAAVRWLAGPAERPGAAGERLIAPGGEGLWRRTPWPVADALFELEPRTRGPALVASPDAERRAYLAGELRGRGHSVLAEERLTRPALERAAVVLLPSEGGGPLPGEAFAVLAARRVLVTYRCEPAFGLLPEIDWFPGAVDVDLVDLADAALAYPEAFDLPRALGRLAAERHRASVVYARLAADLALESV